MKIETTPRDDHQVKIVAEIEPEAMEKFKRQAARKISQDARIPGFRPGKAPYDVVRRMFGDKAIEQEAIEIMLDEVYPQVLKEANIEPSGAGNLDEVISTNPPKFAFTVPLMPKVTLGDYKSIKKAFEMPSVNEDQVDQVIKNLRSNFSSAEPVERPVQEGDLVSLKIKGLLANPAEGEEPEVFKESTPQMLVGENEYEVDDWPFEGFSRELVGLSAGEEKELAHTFADDYVEENLRGKTVNFSFSVQSVKAMNMPEVNDEFAQSVGDFATVEALRTTIRQNLEDNNRRDYENSYFTDLVDQIIALSEIHYPPQLLQEEVDRTLHSLEHDLEDRKLDLPTYLKTLNKEKEAYIEEDIKPVATRRLERSLVMDEVARAEAIKLNPEDFEREVSSTMQIMQSDPEVRKLRGQRAQNFAQGLTMETANRMLNRQVMDRLKALASGEPVIPAESLETAESPSEEPAPAESSEPQAENGPAAESTPAKE